MNQDSEREFQVGQRASLSKTISQEDVEKMAAITGDRNPIHLNEQFAQRTRFKGRIAHGLFGAGLISAVLGTDLPGPGAVYLKQDLEFLQPVRAGDELTAEVEVTKWRSEKRIMTLATRCTIQDGTEVMRGEAVLLVEG